MSFRPWTPEERAIMAQELLNIAHDDNKALDEWISDQLKQIDIEIQEEVQSELELLESIDMSVDENTDLSMALEAINRCRYEK